MSIVLCNSFSGGVSYFTVLTLMKKVALWRHVCFQVSPYGIYLAIRESESLVRITFLVCIIILPQFSMFLGRGNVQEPCSQCPQIHPKGSSFSESTSLPRAVSSTWMYVQMEHYDCAPLRFIHGIMPLMVLDQDRDVTF